MINTTDFKNIIREIVRDEVGSQRRFEIGEIASVNGKPTVRFAGENQPSKKEYSYLDSYTPVSGDRVLLARVKGTYVILGKLISS